jgi:hypothetical protein
VIAALAGAFVAVVFQPWTRTCISIRQLGILNCTTTSGWPGLGGMAGIAAGFLGLSELLWLVHSRRRPAPAKRRTVAGLLVLLVVSLTALEVRMDWHVVASGARIGLGLAVLLLAAVWIRAHVAGKLSAPGETDEPAPE